MRIYRTTDKIPVKINDITVKISPLTFEQKSEVQGLILEQNPLSIVKAARLCIKSSVKEIIGVENEDGSAYQLQFEENGALTDECVDDLLNLDQDDKLSLVCTSLLNGIPRDFIDPQTGQKIEGISIQKAAPRKKK